MTSGTLVSDSWLSMRWVNSSVDRIVDLPHFPRRRMQVAADSRIGDHPKCRRRSMYTVWSRFIVLDLQQSSRPTPNSSELSVPLGKPGIHGHNDLCLLPCPLENIAPATG